MAIFGWGVLALVLVDELLAMAAFGVWGWQASPRWLLVWLLPLPGLRAVRAGAMRGQAQSPDWQRQLPSVRAPGRLEPP